MVSLRYLINQAAESGEQPERVSYHFAQAALNEILPVLLWLLTKQVNIVLSQFRYEHFSNTGLFIVGYNGFKYM